MNLDKEIDRINHELTVTIPEELQLAMLSRDNEANSEISDVLSRQEHLTIRLNQLLARKNNLKNINIHSLSKDSIDIGSTVLIEDIDTGNTRQLKIICGELSDEDTQYEEVTLNSPIGKILRYKQVGDRFTFKMYNSTITYQIVKFTTIHENKLA